MSFSEESDFKDGVSGQKMTSFSESKTRSSSGDSESKEQVLTGWAEGFAVAVLLTLFWKEKVLQFICKTMDRPSYFRRI